MSTGWIVLGIIVVLILFALGAYNRLVALGQRVNQAFADISTLPTSGCASTRAGRFGTAARVTMT